MFGWEMVISLLNHMQTGPIDLIRTCNPQACLRLPRPAAVILMTLVGVRRPTQGVTFLVAPCWNCFGATHICLHALVAEWTLTFQTELLTRRGGRADVCVCTCCVVGLYHTALPVAIPVTAVLQKRTCIVLQMCNFFNVIDTESMHKICETFSW